MSAYPPTHAQTFGFITEQERDDLVARARALNEDPHRQHAGGRRAPARGRRFLELPSAASDLGRFERLARTHFFRFDARHAYWTWDVVSIQQALEEGHGAARVAWPTERWAASPHASLRPTWGSPPRRRSSWAGPRPMTAICDIDRNAPCRTGLKVVESRVHHLAGPRQRAGIAVATRVSPRKRRRVTARSRQR